MKRVGDEIFPKRMRMYEWDPTSVGGKRKQGQQRQRWLDTLIRKLTTAGPTNQEAENTAS